jgi:hypothetical protein
VHGEDLVVAVGADQAAFRSRELDPDQQREDSGEREEDHRGDHVAAANLLVVDRRKPSPQAGLAAPGFRQRVVQPLPDIVAAVARQLGRMLLHFSVAR